MITFLLTFFFFSQVFDKSVPGHSKHGSYSGNDNPHDNHQLQLRIVCIPEAMLGDKANTSCPYYVPGTIVNTLLILI